MDGFCEQPEVLALEVRWGTFNGWTNWKRCVEITNDGAAMRVDWGIYAGGGLAATWLPWEHQIRSGFEARFVPWPAEEGAE